AGGHVFPTQNHFLTLLFRYNSETPGQLTVSWVLKTSDSLDRRRYDPGPFSCHLDLHFGNTFSTKKAI
ncbi:hypothetical protein RWU37_12570, partial [Enterococcus sp. 2CBP]|uniref:hypothetical protein n=1 Tax=Enterococcus sp. 2CBP TaxID=2800793 RepID=UPI0028FD2114